MVPQKDSKDKVQVKEAIKKEAEYKPSFRIKLKSYDHRIIDEAAKDIIETIRKTNVKIIGPIPLPTEKKKYTVLRSTFVHKDSRDQYEMRIHKRLIDLVDVSPETIELLTVLNLPPGVDIEIKSI